jgi:hypothetical protein
MGEAVRWARAIAASVVVAAACGERGEEAPPREVTPQAPAPSAEAPAATPPAEADPAPRQATRRAARGKRAATAVRRVEGTVERATSERVVIRRAGRDPLTLAIGDGTTVTLDGRGSRAEALPPGAEVRASYQNGEGRPRAISIHVRTPPRAADAPPPASSERRRESPAESRERTFGGR